jgi:imidazolonepropionase-like amidohydrolase
VVEEAHRLGLPVAGHAHAVSAVEQCVDAGVDTIEHCSCLGPDGMKTPPALAERMAAAGIIASPTLGMDPTAGDPPPHIQALMDRLSIRWEDRIPQVGALMRAGVTVISGGDAGINPVKPHGVLIYSLANLVECGASIELALASATATAASACGLGGRTGRLRAGLDADLLLVTGDALRDITALRSVHTVVSRGREVVTSG